MVTWAPRVDELYHVRTNVSVERGISRGKIVYMREKYCCSLACTFQEDIKNFEVKIDVQKGSLRFRDYFM
jgi:hypothetical protein